MIAPHARKIKLFSLLVCRVLSYAFAISIFLNLQAIFQSGEMNFSSFRMYLMLSIIYIVGSGFIFYLLYTTIYILDITFLRLSIYSLSFSLICLLFFSAITGDGEGIFNGFAHFIKGLPLIFLLVLLVELLAKKISNLIFQQRIL